MDIFTKIPILHRLKFCLLEPILWLRQCRVLLNMFCLPAEVPMPFMSTGMIWNINRYWYFLKTHAPMMHPYVAHHIFNQWQVNLDSHHIRKHSQVHNLKFVQINKWIDLSTCFSWKMMIRTGPWFNKKMSSYQYMKSHCGDKTVLRPSYLNNGISYTGKMTSLYWIRAQVIMLTVKCSYRCW